MSKITPPAPQHPLRRMQFFLEHPELPKAKEEILRISEFMRTHKKRKIIKKEPVKQVVAEPTPDVIKPVKKSGVLARIFQRKTMAGGA